jgi:SanA protein
MVVKSVLHMALILTLTLFALAALVLLLPRLVTGLYAWTRIQKPDQVANQPVAIVFGAGLWRDGSPTPVLEDRVKTAAELFFAGKVDTLLMSGTTVEHYNETRAMRNYAMSLGIPNEAIVQDYGGLRTYDTCYRALHHYGIERAILVTQSFHLPRALVICNALGLDAHGVSADMRQYRKQSRLWWNLREIPATLVALWEVYVQPPQIALGEPEPIYPNETE